MKNCPSCNLKPTAELEITLDPVVCFSAKLKCKKCKLEGPIFDQIESKAVKDLIIPATKLWDEFPWNLSSEIFFQKTNDLDEDVDEWLKKNQI